MRILTFTLISIILLSFNASPIQIWLTNFDQAKMHASKQNKKILLNFSGSDWCGNCIRLDKTLFQSEEFANFSKENLVLLRADFPAKKKNQLSEEQVTHNEALAEKYNKKGAFPTILVLDENGKVLGQMKQPQNEISDYINDLKQLINQ